MERVLVDTSAIVALLVPEDVAHAEAVQGFETLRRQKARLVMTSAALLETYALLGRRLGLAAAARFRDDFEPLLEVVWIDRTLHEAAMDRWLERTSRRGSRG
jgi:predicted nucleic acid-binding protein